MTGFAFIAESQATWYLLCVWRLLIYVVNGIFVVILALVPRSINFRGNNSLACSAPNTLKTFEKGY